MIYQIIFYDETGKEHKINYYNQYSAYASMAALHATQPRGSIRKIEKGKITPGFRWDHRKN